MSSRNRTRLAVPYTRSRQPDLRHDLAQQDQQTGIHSRVASSALILLVEDDDAVRRAALYLKSVGYTTIAAADIGHAERILTRRIDPGSDRYGLPSGLERPGAELIQRIRARFGRALPALLLSGDTSTAIHDFADTGTFRLLNKPVSADILGNTIAQLLLPPAN
jgi:two-component system CheB/CheR fusion protein